MLSGRSQQALLLKLHESAVARYATLQPQTCGKRSRSTLRQITHLCACNCCSKTSLQCSQAEHTQAFSATLTIPSSAFVQADVQPFTKVLLQFHDHVMLPNLQLNSAATAVNEKSLTKLLDFVKTLASCTNTYPPAMAEPITIMVR